MPRLVDADKVYKVLTEYYHHKTDIQHEALREAIDRMPTVNAVEVVRCKDCKYYEETDNRIGTCLLTISGAEVDGFCAWGERREDGQTD